MILGYSNFIDYLIWQKKEVAIGEIMDRQRVLLDRLIELSCTVVEGIGSLGLTIVNPHSGVSSTTTVLVRCKSNGNSISRLK